MEEAAEREAKTRVTSRVTEASAVSLVPAVPLRRYYRSLHEMFRMAEVYSGEGNLESALTLYVRFSTMWLEALPKHPDYAANDGPLERKKAQGEGERHQIGSGRDHFSRCSHLDSCT